MSGPHVIGRCSFLFGSPWNRLIPLMMRCRLWMPNGSVLSPRSIWSDFRPVRYLLMVFVRRPGSASVAVHSASSISDTWKGVTPRTAQKWTKLFHGVVYVRRVRELSPHQRYRAAGEGRLQSSYQVSRASFAIVSTVNLGRGLRFFLCPIVRVRQQVRHPWSGSICSVARYRGVLCAWLFAGVG